MRILGFSKKWDKLNQGEFTTFRYPRGDRDWFIGEKFQIVYKPRSKGREVLGVAEIICIEQRELDPDFARRLNIPFVTDEEAMTDGFANRATMIDWMIKTYGLNFISLFNKLTLRWIDESNR